MFNTSAFSKSIAPPVGFATSLGFDFAYQYLTSAYVSRVADIVDRLQNAVIFSCITVMDHLMLTESLGFKGAYQVIVPFAAAKARAHLDASLVWIERVADTLSGSPKIASNTLGFPSRRGRSITPIYACLFPVPVIVLSIVDRCCCIAFGDRYMATIATHVLSYSIVRPLVSIAKTYMSLYCWAMERSESMTRSSPSLITSYQLVFDFLAVGLCAFNIFLACVSGCTGVQARSCIVAVSNPVIGLHTVDEIPESIAKIEEFDCNEVLKVDDKGLASQLVKAITPENLHKNFGNDEEDMSVSPVMELDISTDCSTEISFDAISDEYSTDATEENIDSICVVVHSESKEHTNTIASTEDLDSKKAIETGTEPNPPLLPPFEFPFIRPAFSEHVEGEPIFEIRESPSSFRLTPSAPTFVPKFRSVQAPQPQVELELNHASAEADPTLATSHPSFWTPPRTSVTVTLIVLPPKKRKHRRGKGKRGATQLEAQESASS